MKRRTADELKKYGHTMIKEVQILQCHVHRAVLTLKSPKQQQQSRVVVKLERILSTL
jgi:hypothetical protein